MSKFALSRSEVGTLPLLLPVPQLWHIGCLTSCSLPGEGKLPSDGMLAREGYGWAPGSPVCLPASGNRYRHQRASQASHTKLARAEQMSPFSAAKD